MAPQSRATQINRRLFAVTSDTPPTGSSSSNRILFKQFPLIYCRRQFLRCRQQNRRRRSGRHGRQQFRSLHDDGRWLLRGDRIDGGLWRRKRYGDFRSSSPPSPPPPPSQQQQQQRQQRWQRIFVLIGCPAAAAPQQQRRVGTFGWQQQQTQEEDQNRLLSQSGFPAGIDFRHETLPVQLWAGRSSRIAQSDGDPGENLVPEPTQQMEAPIGRRIGSGQYGGQHGSGRGCRPPAHRPRPHPLSREQRSQQYY